MSIKTETEYYPEEKTGSIRFYSGDTLMTEYICDSDGHISMSDRITSHDNDMVQYHSGLKETIKWVREIKKMHVTASKEEHSTFTMNINVDENGISFVYKTILVFDHRKRERIIAKIKYFNEGNKITFYARPAIRLKLVDFEKAVNYNFYLMRLITQLN